MNTQRKNPIRLAWFLSVLVVFAFSMDLAFADDINPPAYRGDPLSVYAHWMADAAGLLSLDQFLWVDDNDPATYLMQFPPTVMMDPATGSYDFRIPNFVDELPIKYLRLQLTWVGTTQPPLSIHAIGYDSGQTFPGTLTFLSNPLVFTQPDGGYQYFDIEFKPNPDFERLVIHLAPDALLVQVVVDSISTIPEPATLGMLALGGLILSVRKRLAR